MTHQHHRKHYKNYKGKKSNRPPPPQLNQQQQQVVMEYLRNNFQKGSQTLNLSQIAMQQPLKQAFGDSVVNANNNQFMDAVANSIPNEVKNTILSVNLSNNNIQDVSCYKYINKWFPNVSSVNLQNNQISSIDDVVQAFRLAGRNFKNISLRGNPCLSKGSPAQIVQTLLSVFPNLENMDDSDLPMINLPVPILPLNLPPVKNFSFTNDNTQSLAKDFVIKFLNIMDTTDAKSRLQLADVYDENAQFSLTVETSWDYEVGQSKKEDLNELKKTDHNLKAQRWENTRQQRVRKQRYPIADFLSKYPCMKHNIEKVNLDGHLIQGNLILLVIHGEFRIEGYDVRCFDRTFLLGAPADAQRQKGWNLRILNDQWHIRPLTTFKNLSYQHHDRFSTSHEGQTNPMQSSPMQSTFMQSNPMQSFMPSNPMQSNPMQSNPMQSNQMQSNQMVQQQMVQRLSNETGMNLQFSMKCLQDVQFVYAKALEIFQQNRQRIPPEAFRK